MQKRKKRKKRRTKSLNGLRSQLAIHDSNANEQYDVVSILLLNQAANRISKNTRTFNMRESDCYVLRFLRGSGLVDSDQHAGLLARQHEAADETKPAPCKSGRGICAVYSTMRK